MPASFYGYSDVSAQGARAAKLQSGFKYHLTNHNPVSWSIPTAASHYGTSHDTGRFNEDDTWQEPSANDKIAIRWAIQQIREFIAHPISDETTESDTVHGDLRFGRTNATHSDGVSVAWCWPINNVAQGAQSAGSDAWFRIPQADASVGNNTWMNWAHEAGHGLGLKHAHESSGDFPVMDSAYDHISYTIMSYKSKAGASNGYTNASYPQTYMQADIANLQSMYGANTTTRAGSNTTVHLNPSTGVISVNGVQWSNTPPANKLFATLPWANHAAGGHDYIIDCADYTTAQTIDLRPGEGSITSTTQRVDLDGGTTFAFNFFVPLNLNPTKFKCGTGATTVQGNSVTNTVQVIGNRSAYTAANPSGTTYTLTHATEGLKTITDIDFVQFADQTVAVGDLVVAGFTQLVITVTN